MKETEKSRAAALNSVSRFKKAGSVTSPIKGLYIIIPPEYNYLRCLPSNHVIPIIMGYLKQNYYVCLLSAAHYHGASHQKAQVFQVMINKRMRNIHCGNVRIEFIYKKSLRESQIEEIVMPTGYLMISTPEQTIFDIIKHISKSGGINSVATLVSELIEKIRPVKLIELAKKVSEHTWLQRIGYIIDNIDPIDTSKQIKIVKAITDYLISLESKFTYVSLHPGMSRKGAHNKKWKIIENTTIESDI
jgi:predicted transcriptional regulator of viral defense system